MWLTLKRLLDTQISDYRLGPTFAADIRARLADMPHRELARHLSGGLTYGEIPASIKNMVVDTTILMTLL